MINNDAVQLSETSPDDGPSGGLQGKNFGNAQIIKASLLFFKKTNKKYYLRISKIFRSETTFW